MLDLDCFTGQTIKTEGADNPNLHNLFQRILRKKNTTGGIRLPDFGLYYKASHTNSITQKQKYRLMEQDRNPRNKSMHLWSINLWQSRQEYTMEKKTASLISDAGKTGPLHVEEWI